MFRSMKIGAAALAVVAIGYTVVAQSVTDKRDDAQMNAGSTPRTEMLSGMTAKQVLGDVDPWDIYLGEVWIRHDGMVFIGLGDGRIAFDADLAGLDLVENKNNVVAFTAAGQDDKLIHRFEDVGPDVGRNSGAAYYNAGACSIDYDEESRVLSVDLAGGTQTFVAKFDFTNAEHVPPVDPDAEPVLAWCAEQCYAVGSECASVTDANGGVNCFTCPLGYHGVCRLTPGNGSIGSRCWKLRAQNVAVQTGAE